MRRTFSLIAASLGTLILAGLCNPALAQSTGGYHPYHSGDTYSHTSSTTQAPLVPPYHSFTMDPPYAPSFTPHTQYGPVYGPGDHNSTTTTTASPSESFWHSFGNVDVDARQRRAAGATVTPPYVPPSYGHPHPYTPNAISRMQQMYPNAVPYYARPEHSQEVHAHHIDAPPGD